MTQAIVFRDRRSTSAGPSLAKPDEVYRHERIVPRGWQEELERAVPRSDKLSWLLIRWEPGDVWQPVQRWLIWHVRPLSVVRPDILKELSGPHPRSEGHYCGSGYCLCPVKRNRWRNGASHLIDRAQWEIFREVGSYATRWWTIQGTLGGHRYRLDPIEEQVMKLHTGETDTPSPGDLPYAEFDRRVLTKVAAFDQVRMWKGLIDYYARSQDAMDKEEEDASREANGLLWKWLETQSRKIHDGISRKEWGEFSQAVPRQAGISDRHLDYEAMQEDFITDTAV